MHSPSCLDTSYGEWTSASSLRSPLECWMKNLWTGWSACSMQQTRCKKVPTRTLHHPALLLENPARQVGSLQATWQCSRAIPLQGMHGHSKLALSGALMRYLCDPFCNWKVFGCQCLACPSRALMCNDALKVLLFPFNHVTRNAFGSNINCQPALHFALIWVPEDKR